MKRLCIFCGSSEGRRPVYMEAARSIAGAMARRGIGLVYGGGRAGLMGMAADTVLAAGGEVIGVIPEAMVAREVAHTGLTKLHVVASMHERKALMAELADGFVALPGGFGTFEELCEIITWSQLGLHRKPCGLLDVDGYYRPLLELFDHATAEEFIRPEHREIVLVENDPERLLDLLAGYVPPSTRRWLEPEES